MVGKSRLVYGRLFSTVTVTGKWMLAKAGCCGTQEYESVVVHCGEVLCGLVKVGRSGGHSSAQALVVGRSLAASAACIPARCPGRAADGWAYLHDHLINLPQLPENALQCCPILNTTPLPPPTLNPKPPGAGRGMRDVLLCDHPQHAQVPLLWRDGAAGARCVDRGAPAPAGRHLHRWVGRWAGGQVGGVLWWA